MIRLLTRYAVMSLLFLSLIPIGAGCRRDKLRDFDIPAGSATTTLMTFADQAEVEIILDDQNISLYRTNSVKGNMTPLKALERMTKSTGLNFTHDQSSNAYAVSSELSQETQ